MLKPGDVYTTEVVFKQEDVDDFARITGDYNLVHTDDQYAVKLGFRQRIVHGMYAASPFSRILGMSFPGKGSVVMYRELQFVRPVYVNVRYNVQMRLVEVDYSTHEGFIKSVLKNEKGQICVKGMSRVKNIEMFSRSV